MDLEERFGVLLKKINLKYENRINEVVRKHDLTRAQCDIIVFLVKSKDHEVTQREIERFFNISNPTVTGVLNRLETKGFIVRKASVKDARYKIIESTDKAKGVDEKIRSELDRNDTEIFSVLNDQEKVELRKLLKKVIKNL